MLTTKKKNFKFNLLYKLLVNMLYVKFVTLLFVTLKLIIIYPNYRTFVLKYIKKIFFKN